MSKFRDPNRVRTIFYPMAGSVEKQFGNLLETLRWINTSKPTPAQVNNWLANAYELSPSFARDVYTVLFISSGLVGVYNGKCRLTAEGQAVLATSSPIILLEVFEKTFAGVAAFLEVLRDHPHIKSGALNELWFETVQERFPKMKNWNKRTLNTQCRHRIDWLRTMGFVTVINGLFALSESGWQFVQENPPEAIAIQRQEVKQQEKQLNELTLGMFEPFDSTAEKVLSLRQAYVRDHAFREIVAAQYGHHCAICDFCFVSPKGIYESEAAHIVPKRRRGTDDPRNGLCLCGTCHWLFDQGIVSLQIGDLSVTVARYVTNLANDQSVQRVLAYQGRQIRTVKDPNYMPATEAIEWHHQYIFLG